MENTNAITNRTVDSYLLVSQISKEYDADTYHTIRSLLVYELAKSSQGNPLERIAKFGGIAKLELTNKDKQFLHLTKLRMAAAYLISVGEIPNSPSTNRNLISFSKIGSILGDWDRSTIYCWYHEFQKEKESNYPLIKEILSSSLQESKHKIENTSRDYWNNLNNVLFWMEEISKRKDFSINSCLDLVSEYTWTSKKVILAKNRSRDFVSIRAGATYLFRKKLRLSLPATGYYMSRDHTSILNQERMIKELITKESLFIGENTKTL